MLAPDGFCLSTCDKRKAQWYLSKGLAEVKQEDPLVIKLKFEPCDTFSNREKARKLDIEDPDEEFYISERVTQCVVCGSD
mmetsp:Transcript_39561/g.60452  ORF Transcript_39561/g.60452 Transcript_39561/m.60452 type:complete len:80 (+) Transcript_39561:22-261(+)|eukprot:CAMPEP_0170499200 /NCGR_PEP_ID=MMETSP0208-20121228/30492_1 /TAXON_ID=197538 /ORGANISM="Strombidium inclinatum, Strain S3" /LENGTH=79 /DNA_ID=CAMNT_0010776661 /DNA_START=1375 /DNA_END=1614 /DNA_ORIENTATION=+